MTSYGVVFVSSIQTLQRLKSYLVCITDVKISRLNGKVFTVPRLDGNFSILFKRTKIRARVKNFH